MDSAALLAVILVQPAPVFGFRIRTAALQLQVVVQPVFIARAQVLLQHLGFAHAGFHQLNIHPLLFVQVLEQRLAHGSVLRLSAGLSGQKHAVIRITKIGIFQRVIPVNGCRVVFQVGVDGVILFALHFHGFGHSGFLTVSRFRGSGTGGNGFLCRHISIQKVLQNRNVGSPIRIHHGAVIHAVAHAIGALHRQGHLVCCHAQKARQLHHQGSDLSFCKVGLHHRQGGVQQVVQLGDRSALDLVQHRLDDGALAGHAVPVIINGAQAGILQCGIAVEVVPAWFHLVDDQHRVGGNLPVQRLGFVLSQVQVDAAHGIHNLNKGVKIEPHIVVHLHVEAVFHRIHRQAGTAVTEGVGDPVVLALVPIQQNRHTGGALNGNQFDGIVLDVQGTQN